MIEITGYENIGKGKYRTTFDNGTTCVLYRTEAVATAGLVGAGIAAVGSVFSTATSVSQQFSHIKGGLGGRAGAEANANIVLTVSYWKISDTPSNCLTTIGLPLFKSVTLGSLSGLVKCSGAWVKAECTDTEHQMIAQYVNSSTNFIYGGLIIE